MDDHLQQLLSERHDTLMTAIAGVHDRLDTLNGRTREAERKIAVLHDRQKLLWGGIGTIGAALAAWIVERVAR